MSTTNSGTTASETFGTTSPVTGSAPTSATDGQPLADLDAITVIVSAADTRTLSGAGTLKAYILDTSVTTSTTVWARASAFDLSVTATTQAQCFPAFQVIAPRKARIKWVPDSVTFSAGSAGVTVYQLGYNSKFKGMY